MSALQVISYEFTEPSCGEMPYYVSSFLMHIQPCIIVERMLQTAQLTLQNGVKPKSESTMLCPECFFRFVWWFTNSHLNEICEFQLPYVLCMILYDLICPNMWIHSSDSIILFLHSLIAKVSNFRATLRRKLRLRWNISHSHCDKGCHTLFALFSIFQ